MECDFYSGSTINIARVEEVVTSPVRGKPTRREETRAATNEGEGRGGEGGIGGCAIQDALRN